MNTVAYVDFRDNSPITWNMMTTWISESFKPTTDDDPTTTTTTDDDPTTTTTTDDDPTTTTTDSPTTDDPTRDPSYARYIITIFVSNFLWLGICATLVVFICKRVRAQSYQLDLDLFFLNFRLWRGKEARFCKLPLSTQKLF